MANYIVTTRDEYTEKDVVTSGIITKMVGSLKEYQKVVAIGPMVRSINVGDIVCINPRRYAVYKHNPGSLKDGVIGDNPVIKYNFHIVELDHVPHLLITDQDIDFVIEESEEEKESQLIIPENKILV